MIQPFQKWFNRKVLLETIAETDFYDFYALATAYYHPHSTPDKRWEKEIERELMWKAELIFDDKVNDLWRIIVENMAELPPNYQNLSLGEKTNIIQDIIKKYEKRYSEFPEIEWAKTWLELIKTNKNPPSLIYSIDRIFSLAHHISTITDYFKEPWLEDALHFRTLASLPQLISRASNDVRELLTSASWPRQNTKITNMAKTSVSLNRYFQNRSFKSLGNFDARYNQNDDTITITPSNIKIIETPNGMFLIHDNEKHHENEDGGLMPTLYYLLNKL
jgi:hypothetical protein